MKILYVINQISDWSGDSGLLWLSVKLMKKRGHEVAIATTDGNPFRDKDSIDKYSKKMEKLSKSKENFVIINDIPVYSVHCITSHFGMYAPNAGKMAKKIIQNFDIIHIYSWYHHIGIEFFRVAKKKKITLVLKAMGTLQNDAQKFYKTQKSIIDFMFTKKIINYAAVLHSVGSSEFNSYLQYGGDIKKIIQIDNGIEPKDFELKKPTNILKKIDIENKPYILFLGRIHPKKGIELLIKSFKELSLKNDKIWLVIAGSGQIEYIQRIKKQVNDLSLTNRIKFTGFISQDDKLTLLKSAKLFSLTSKSDIHPRAVQEALVMGVPVVVSKESDYPEIEECDTGKIVNMNYLEIAHTFEKLLENEEKLQILSKNARKLINDKFLAEEQIIKFEKIYQKISK